jgi:6-methylsalicylate decarboxylase
VSAPGIAVGPAGRRPALARACNEESTSIVAEVPGRLGLFASLPLPDVDASLEEVRRSLDDLGADGVVVFTNTEGVYLSDPRLDPVLEELNRRAALVFLHPAVPPRASELGMVLPPAFVEFTFDTTRAAVDLIVRGTTARFPRIRFLLAHLGGALPFLAWRLSMLEDIPGGAFTRGGVREHLRHFWYDTATCGPASVAAAVAEVGADRVVYGSDTPWAPAAFVERTTTALDTSTELDETVKARIRTGTATALLERRRT